MMRIALIICAAAALLSLCVTALPAAALADVDTASEAQDAEATLEPRDPWGLRHPKPRSKYRKQSTTSYSSYSSLSSLSSYSSVSTSESTGGTVVPYVPPVAPRALGPLGPEQCLVAGQEVQKDKRFCGKELSPCINGLFCAVPHQEAAANPDCFQGTCASQIDCCTEVIKLKYAKQDWLIKWSCQFSDGSPIC